MAYENGSFRGKRLFIAISLPEYVQASIASLEESVKGFHWVPESRLHLTLKFIGDVPGQFQERIEKAISSIEVGQFLLPVQGLGVFPPRGQPHALWAGLSTAHPRLFQLQKKLEDALFQIGIEPEKRIYRPHITIARVNHANMETVKQFIKRHENFGAAPFRVDSFQLLRSEVLAGKRVYSKETSWPLLPDQHPVT